MNENGHKVEHIAAQMFVDGLMSKEDYKAHVERMERIYVWEQIGLLIANLILVVGMGGIGILWALDII